MGKSQDDAEAMSNEVPAHPVTLTGAYYLGRFEVTQAQWKKVMGDEARERREPATAGTGAVQIGGAGGAVFAGLCWISGVQELREIADKVRRRLRRSATRA